MVLVLVLLIIIVVVVLYIRKVRKIVNYLWCYNCDIEIGVFDIGNYYKLIKGNYSGGLGRIFFF